MRTKSSIALLALSLIFASACSRNDASNRMQQDLERSLQQAGLKDVKAEMDHKKGIVTLSGKVKSEEERQKAGQVAQAAAAGHAVANEVAIEPPGQESEARAITENIDTAIEKSYKALLIANHMDSSGIKFHSKNGVLTLEGKVKDADTRASAEKIAATVPHIEQVVNKVEVAK